MDARDAASAASRPTQVAPSTLFWDNSVVIGGFVVLFSAVYLALYWRIVRFRSPRLLRALRSRPLPPGAGDNRGR